MPIALLLLSVAHPPSHGADTPQLVEFEITAPRVDHYESVDPNVYVEGIVKAPGEVGQFDIVIALDASQSTSGPSGGDINRDGVVDDDYQSADSIYKAQIQAAFLLQHMLSRVPLNELDERGNRRVRLGLVTYSGAGDLQNHLTRDVSLSYLRRRGRFRRMLERDAEIESELTADYSEFRTRLAKTSLRQDQSQLGTFTNFVAGLAKASNELDANGRPDAHKVIFFMTDGEPTAPFNRYCGDHLAMGFAKELREGGIRINAFGIAPDANRDVSRWTLGPPYGIVGTTGTYTSVRSPADIIDRIRDRTSSVVRAGAIVNRRGNTVYPGQKLHFNLDGTFSGMVPVQEGANQIEIHIETVFGSKAVHRIPLAFSYPQGFSEAMRAELAAERLNPAKRVAAPSQIKSLKLEIEEDDRPRSRQTGESKLEILEVR